MTYAELSRRVGRLTATDTWLALDAGVKEMIAGEVSEADDFEELSDLAQEKILAAEAELAA